MAYWRYVEPQSTTHCAKRQAERAWRLPRFPQPRQGTEFPAPSTCRSMPPCQLVRAPREHCALLLCTAAHGFGLR